MPGRLDMELAGEPRSTDERMQFQPLIAGRNIVGTACVRKKTPGQTKAGQPYLTVEFGNATGTVSAKIWSESVGAWQGITVGDPVHIEGRLTAGWRGGPPELQVTRVEALPTPHPVQLEVNPVSPVPLHELQARFHHLLGYLSEAAKALVDVVLEHVGTERWWTAPAAKGHHHAHVHGLALHSLQVAETSLALSKVLGANDRIDVDALMVGALLHDVGKVSEYVWQGVPIDLSRDALTNYHTASGGVMTMVAVERARDRLAAAGVTEAMVQHLVHVQLSHHGEAAFGSPVPPRTLEALLVHHADLASARVQAHLDDLASGPPDADGWVTPAGWGKKPVLAYAVQPKVPLRQAEPKPPAEMDDAAAVRSDACRDRPSGASAVELTDDMMLPW